MKRLPLFLILLLASPAFASEQSILARITVYWHSEGSQMQASSNGARLHNGHCAVDPKKIPYGSQVLFPDDACLAVDTGPAVVSRKAARLLGRTVLERAAVVVDRFFATKQQALTWEKAHPYFMTLRVITPEHRAKHRAEHGRALMTGSDADGVLGQRHIQACGQHGSALALRHADFGAVLQAELPPQRSRQANHS